MSRPEIVTITFADGTRFQGLATRMHIKPPETMSVSQFDSGIYGDRQSPEVVIRESSMELELTGLRRLETPSPSPVAPTAPETEDPAWGTWS